MRGAAYTIEDQRRMAEARNYFAWQARLITGRLGRRVVEVGCGLGNFTGLLLDHEMVLAVDVEPGCIEYMNQRYPGQPNLHTFVCDAASEKFGELACYKPDCCVCLNVLEHIEDDRAALRNMAAILDPHGTILLLLPAFPCLYGPIDRNLGHYRRYSRRSVRELAAAVGLRIQKLHYMNLIGFFGWWANSHLFRRTAQSSSQIGIFDRWIVPLESRLESIITPPFGQSLFAVLVRE